MNESTDNWSDERVQAEPLTLADAIAELETTRAVYEHVVMEA